MMLSALGLALHAWWALRWDGLGIRKTSAQAGDKLPDTCSVVVCCHNEAPRVAGFHEALRPALNHAAARGVHVQVVAVNHGSTDGTAEALEALRERAGWTVVHQSRTRPSKKEALEAGMAAATGQVVLVTDIDCTPLAPEWLEAMLRGASAQWDVCVGLSLPGCGAGWLHVFQQLEAERSAQKAVGAVVRGRPYLGFGRNMAFTREMWTRVGGMSKHAHVRSGDDDLWLQEAVALGARVTSQTSAAAQTASSWPATWEGWRRQKTRHVSASSVYPMATLVRLALPTVGTGLLAAGVVHNPSGTSVLCAGSALLLRAVTFGLFLHQAGRPPLRAWTLLLEPAVGLFRSWSWWKGATTDSTAWK